ncbi:MAG: signal peptidase I [Planctomycetaceae bacterium]
MESLIALALAVVLFRTFAVEGYMISTGSMAPSLLGYHKRVTCSKCQMEFPFGVAFDESVDSGRKENGKSPQWAVCPNCGQDGIDARNLPRNEGDQLLVHKDYYSFVQPRRWEVVVFRNPDNPTEVYVKRVVGLPGESIQIRNGDIHINGRLNRKTLAAQQATRIPVYDDRFQPRDDPFWKTRWFAVGGERRVTSGPSATSEASLTGTWEVDGSNYRLSDANSRESASTQPRRTTLKPEPEFADDNLNEGSPTNAEREHAAPSVESENIAAHRDVKWLEYRQWIRSGGKHRTSVPLLEWPAGLLKPEKYHDQLSYHTGNRELSCMGAFLPDVAKHVMLASKDLAFRKTIYRLYEKSHVSPLTDDYGYNRSLPWHDSVHVQDLMCEFQLEIDRGEGVFQIEMPCGQHLMRVVFDVGAGRIQLLAQDQAQPLRTAELRESWHHRPIAVAMSVFDQQVLLAIDDEPVFAAYPVQWDRLETITGMCPVRLGGKGLDLRVSELQLYRDIYYTAGKGRHGIHEPHQLGDDEYFMLGDNSPVSLDSRSWGTAGVKRDQLLGKPMIVHLPSKPGKFRWKDHEVYFRVPDVSRIRYIR